jgi:pimeloyl-ACP methyl ester carboxylesterase
VDLHHVRRGTGPQLVLIHGLGSEWEAWEPVLDALAREHEVIALDLPGFGASAPLPAGTRATIPALTDAVAAFLEREGIERPAVAGFSMGGAISLELARRGAVRSVVAISPAGFWTDRERAFTQRSVRNARSLGGVMRPAVLRNPFARTVFLGQFFGRPWKVPPEAALRAVETLQAARALNEANDAFSEYRFRRGEELAHVPVTVAWGTRDFLLLPREGRRTPRLIPHARLVWLAGCGHIPFWDDPDTVARSMLDGVRVDASRPVATFSPATRGGAVR